MRITLPVDCGNAPRIAIVGEFVTSWAHCNSEAVAEWLSDDVTWTVIGKVVHRGEDVAERVCPSTVPDGLEVTSVITHGRLASCDGFLETDSGRSGFSHVLRFASTSKSARIVEVRSYLIENHRE